MAKFKDKEFLKNYRSVHRWLKITHGKANKCENLDCGNKSATYQWSKLKEFEYEKKRESFIMLCRNCHGLYDFHNFKMALTKEEIKKTPKIISFRMDFDEHIKLIELSHVMKISISAVIKDSLNDLYKKIFNSGDPVK